MRPIVFFDMEVYPNYTLCLFKNAASKELRGFEYPFDLDTMRELVNASCLVTFNGLNYDIPILMYALTGASALEIKKASDRIIVHNLKPWHFEREFNVKLNDPELDHIDLREVAPLAGGLKLYGGRMHSRSLQDLPIPPGKMVTEEEKVILRSYCANDLQTTEDLFNTLKVQLELRESMSKTYGIDLRSKSDAQIAEAVIRSEVERRTGHRLDRPGHGPGDRFHYQIPSWMSFWTLDILSVIKDAWFTVSQKGSVLMPKELTDRKIQIGNGIYRMGIGGLHSSEESRAVVADDDHVIFDYDVASYYPAILLNQGLYPKHIGVEFLNVYRDLVNTRLTAKKAGRKTEAESLKICVNGTFGKLASKYSILYSPDIFIQITVTGQLALLMLIEALASLEGTEVISANTDGVTVRVRKLFVSDVQKTVNEWEQLTGFTTEQAEYSGLYSRDVNNYVAVKTDGDVKVKGAYGKGLPLQKNPTASICAKAVIDYLTLDASVHATIYASRDVRDFVSIRTVKGGALWRGKEIGKIVRWYYSNEETEALLYKVNGYLVPKTLGARPLVMLPDSIPDDLDREWYVKEANEMLRELGVKEDLWSAASII